MTLPNESTKLNIGFTDVEIFLPENKIHNVEY